MNKQIIEKSTETVQPLENSPNDPRKAPPRARSLPPGSVADIRAQLGLSQERFAQAFGISVDTLQNWEQGRRQPTGPARVLLKIAARDPAAMLKSVA